MCNLLSLFMKKNPRSLYYIQIFSKEKKITAKQIEKTYEGLVVAAIFGLYRSPEEEEFCIKIQESMQISKQK